MLEKYFDKYRKNILGIDQYFEGPYGRRKIYYADWTASGRLYGPIEDVIRNQIAPFVGNTHTETTITGSSMTMAYQKAKDIIKEKVNANETDILISSNSGTTGVINKLQRILGLKIHEKYINNVHFDFKDRPVVFVSHMEHHSNQTSWLETICKVVIINADSNGRIDLAHFEELLKEHKNCKVKIAAITACSNVTGIITPYHEIAEIIHHHDGHCFVDFACSAPYVKIDMHPENEMQKLDAIYFSPHKFLGGPASSGILIFCQTLYSNKIPDNPGGGTVDWTNPWGEHKYHDEIEAREDGGTPGFIQTIRAALCFKLKEQMSISKMMEREEELQKLVWSKLNDISNLHILADNIKNRLCVFSFYISDLHYNLGVKILNDRFGIQVRGGCSCAGTYGHYLLKVSHEKSKRITESISCGLLSQKPGWIRMSLHPVMNNEEVIYILDAIIALCKNHGEWSKDYQYQENKNEWLYNGISDKYVEDISADWFNISMA